MLEYLEAFSLREEIDKSEIPRDETLAMSGIPASVQRCYRLLVREKRSRHLTSCVLAFVARVALGSFRLIARCNALVAMGLEREYARGLGSDRYARSTIGRGNYEGPLSRSVGFVLTKQMAFTRDVWSQSG